MSGTETFEQYFFPNFGLFHDTVWSLNTQLGNTVALDVAAVAALLLAKIKSAVFPKQFDVIYDLNSDQVIAF